MHRCGGRATILFMQKSRVTLAAIVLVSFALGAIGSRLFTAGEPKTPSPVAQPAAPVTGRDESAGTLTAAPKAELRGPDVPVSDVPMPPTGSGAELVAQDSADEANDLPIDPYAELRERAASGELTATRDSSNYLNQVNEQEQQRLDAETGR